MHKLRAGLLALLCVGAIAGCKTNTSPGDIKFLPPVMQLAVGTLNDNFGTLTGTAGVYLNAVTTFRNNLGNSAFINPGTGTLTGPGGINVNVGSLFAYGQGPGGNGVQGAPPAYSPPSSAGGYATGFILTGVTPPVAGAYHVVSPVTVNGVVQPWNASATLPAAFTTLGPDAGATYVRDASLDGGGTFTFAAPPAGVTESVVYVVCLTSAGAAGDPCGGTTPPGTPVASAEVTGATLTATLPPGTLFTNDTYTCVVLGADYPLVEAGPPANHQQAPTLTGANGTSDLSASASFVITG